MFGLGLPELIVILVIILVLFGASKLPEVGSSLGKGLRSFKKEFSDLKDSIQEPEEPNKKKTK